MHKPMFSVAICTFNGEKYINKQLKSILNQTVPIDEIVLCDDCSTDKTVQIVKDIATKQSHITFNIIVNETNIGVKRNFEKALKLCQGDIKFLSDQDDVWHPSKVERIKVFFDNNPDKDVVMTNAILINNDNQIIDNKTLLECVGLNHNTILSSNTNVLTDLFLNFNRATGATMAIKKTVPINFNYETPILHDYILAIEALSRDSLGIIEEPLIKYRIHQGQAKGIGEAVIHQWDSDIYELGYERFDNYPLPTLFTKKIEMRNKRYHWMAGLRGLLPIFLNWKKYKEIYTDNWKSFMHVDINRTIALFKKRHQDK